MIKPLTSLRFFFAFIVFLSHLPIIYPTNSTLTNLQKDVFAEGYLGVSFFFILSGFILSLTYKNKLINNKVPLKEFWIARIARIYPLHLFTLLIAIPLSLTGILASTGVWLGKLFINILLLQSFFPQRSIYFSFNYPSWSISAESFFYLLFPFIISIHSKYPKTIYLSLVLITMIPLGIFLCPEDLQHRFFYINPFFRMVDFIVGILIYNIYEKIKTSSWLESKTSITFVELFSVLLFACFFAFHSFVPQGYRYSCYYWMPMITIILAFSYQAGYLSRILSNRILVLLGEISFSFYLIHQLAIRYIGAINSKFSLISDNLLLMAIILVFTLLASYLSYHLIELPSSKYIKSKYKKSKLNSK